MPYDEFTSERINRILKEKQANYFEKKMFGGMCFMVNDKMCCGIHYDKKKATDLLMIRIGQEAYENSKDRTGCHPMDFTGRPMRDYAFITPDGYDSEEDLEYWIQLALDFNPFAKASKKRSKK